LPILDEGFHRAFNSAAAMALGLSILEIICLLFGFCLLRAVQTLRQRRQEGATETELVGVSLDRQMRRNMPRLPPPKVT
jgi:hypothetical protein